MRRTLLFLNLALASIFALALSVLTFAPSSVERQAHRELVRRVSSAAMERYPTLRSPRWTDAINAALRGEAAELRVQMASPELEVVAAVFSAMCRHDCPDRKTVANLLREGMAQRLQVFDRAMQRVEAWARGHYHELVGELVNDLEIFCATNFVLCILAACAARVRATDRVVVVTSAILTLTVATGACFYLFGQH